MDHVWVPAAHRIATQASTDPSYIRPLCSRKEKGQSTLEATQRHASMPLPQFKQRLTHVPTSVFHSRSWQSQTVKAQSPTRMSGKATCLNETLITAHNATLKTEVDCEIRTPRQRQYWVVIDNCWRRSRKIISAEEPEALGSTMAHNTISKGGERNSGLHALNQTYAGLRMFQTIAHFKFLAYRPLSSQPGCSKSSATCIKVTKRLVPVAWHYGPNGAKYAYEHWSL